MGTTGLVMSGAVTFDHRASPDGDLAACHESISFDPGNGHSSKGGNYHYHMVSPYKVKQSENLILAKKRWKMRQKK